MIVVTRPYRDIILIRAKLNLVNVAESLRNPPRLRRIPFLASEKMERRRLFMCIRSHGVSCHAKKSLRTGGGQVDSDRPYLEARSRSTQWIAQFFRRKASCSTFQADRVHSVGSMPALAIENPWKFQATRCLATISSFRPSMRSGISAFWAEEICLFCPSLPVLKLIRLHNLARSVPSIHVSLRFLDHVCI